MKIRKKCYCILIFILLLFSLCSCSKTNKNNGTNNNLNANNAPSTDSNNNNTNNTTTNTTEPPQQNSTPIGTRTNPLPFNTTVLFNGNDTLFDKYQAELTLLDVVRGPDALAMVLDANEFNSEPAEGKEYLLAKFKIRALSSEDDAMIDINNASFSLVSEDGTVYDSFISISDINPSLREMYAGATMEGYACFEVNTDDINPSIVFLERNNNGIWFSTNPNTKLPEGSTAYVPAESIPSPDTTYAEIGSRLNPIALGTTTTFDGMDTLFDTYRAQVTLKEVIRGDAAMDIVAKANKLNVLPADDEEYLLAKFEINALESLDNAKIEISAANFELVSEDGIKYDDFVTIAGLEPTLSDIYPGSKQEGYAYFFVKKNDLNPKIVFLERNNHGLWFATNR
ncbi:hypothetical protein [Anaerosporobacter sp.]